MHIKLSLFSIPIAIFTLLLLSHIALASIYLNVSVSPAVPQAGQNINIHGTIVNTTASEGLSSVLGVNVSARITSAGWNASTTSASSSLNGTFNFNISAPTTIGNYSILISTNSSSLVNRHLPVFVSDMTSGIIAYTNAFPPFSNGTRFTVNITLFNGTSPLSSYYPNVSVFYSLGGPVNWTIQNLSATTNASGIIQFNITIPASVAPGKYVISVERGKLISVFEVRAGYVVTVQTLTTADELTPNFGESTSIRILAKVRDTSSNPVSGATVTASVTLPSGTVSTLSLSAHPSSSGYYNNTFTSTSARGTYNIKVKATIGGVGIEGATTFNIRAFSVQFERAKRFFFEWGGQGAFKPSQTAALNVIVTNLTDTSTVPSSSLNNCGVDSFRLVGVFFPNGTEVPAGTTYNISSANFTTEPFPGGTNVCKIQFTTQSESGTYAIRVNVTFGNSSLNADGFYSVQQVFLRATPVSSFGGDESFMSTVEPGSNVTLALKAVDVASGASISPANITGIAVKKLFPLESAGGSEVTNVTYNAHPSTDANVDPTIDVLIPASVMGPMIVEVQANASGNITTGSAFFVSNYLSGFASPEVSGFGGSGMPLSQCSGTVQFSGFVNEAKSGTAAQGASIVGIIEAREEETGKNIASMLSIPTSTASTSSGAITANVTFSPTGGYSFSGFYFIVFNASYKGNYAGIPGMFMCRTLDLGFPQIQTIGSSSTFSWQIAPTAAMKVSLSNVKHLNGSLIGNVSNFSIDKIFNFNPSTGGMQVLIPRNFTASSISFDTTFTNGVLSANNASLTLNYSDFLLGGANITKWPTGFFDLRPKVVSDIGTDTGFGGFMVVPFDAFPESFTYGSVAVGSTQSYTIAARTNVSLGCQSTTKCDRSGISVGGQLLYSGSNQTGFKVKIGRPWEGELTTLTGVNATLLGGGPAGALDNWNASGDMGFERWNITFGIPTSVSKGGAQLLITVNNSNNEEMDIPLFMSVTKYSVVIPYEDGVGGGSGSEFDFYFLPQGGANPYFDMTNNITNTYGISSQSGNICVKRALNSTRFGVTGNPVVNHNSNIHVAVVDRYTAGVYDTVLLNDTVNNKIIILNQSQNITHRSFGNATGQSGLYLWNIEQCGYFSIINTTINALLEGNNFVNNRGFSPKQINLNMTIPYVMFLGSGTSAARQVGASVSINGIAKQDSRGFGFVEKLTRNTNFTSWPQYVNTDANGVAFIHLNVANAGRFMAFWKVNVTSAAADTDTGDMSSGVMVQIQNFRTYGNSINLLPNPVVSLLHRANTDGYLNSFTPIGSAIFNESAIFNANVTGLITAGTIYNISYGPGTNQTKIVLSTTPDFSTTGGTEINSTSRITIGSSSIAVSELIGNTTATGNITLHFANPSSASNPITVSTATANVSVIVCAENFAKPTNTPVRSATLNLSVTDWSTFPSTTKYLDMYSPFDASIKYSATQPAKTGPAGCIALLVGPGGLGSWPSASGFKPPVFIEGTVTNTAGQQESMYVADVFRA